ncbi:MAG: 30S ribosomal protein S5 [Candidatus Parcubacteria bacterium]|nr:30S ribosomal protein S5 [Candidatus Parcubacteria bacterium]
MEKKKFSKIEKSEYDQKTLEIRRVTRVVAGGKRMSFRAAVLLGDKKGKVAVGLAKGADVSQAIDKAVSDAKKHFVKVSIFDGTIRHNVLGKFKASKVIIKPAVKGRGIVAGGAVREVLFLAGYNNVSAKIVGTSTNQINNAQATLNALSHLKSV